jgi:hypothetical protein
LDGLRPPFIFLGCGLGACDGLYWSLCRCVVFMCLLLMAGVCVSRVVVVGGWRGGGEGGRGIVAMLIGGIP